jgi:putative N6-adenine-specific DNA methylase
MKLIIRTLKGLEPALLQELEELGATETQQLTRAVACEGDLAFMYKCNNRLKCAIKVMMVIGEYEVNNIEQLYIAAKRIPWEKYVDVSKSLAVEGLVNSTLFNHSQYVALKTKDAIVDRFREVCGNRPNINAVAPQFAVISHIRNNILTLLLDSSGSSLHLRGYRVYPTEAPLNEVLAAGLVRLSGWDKKTTLIDPMCGSGTIGIEALLYAANMPAQKSDRQYCFMNWKDFDSSLWKQELEESKKDIDVTDLPKIILKDKNLKAITAAQANVAEVPHNGAITIEKADFFSDEGAQNMMLITNPPYDQRLKDDDIISFYKEIGNKLKHGFINTTAWVLSGNLMALKHLGLRPSKKIQVLNGDIEAGFYKFDIYEGSKKNMVK